ncbi:MAG: YjjG family noncanonical pyrimidine nucleotidase [Flavobacteriales bacterium]|nr:YjjG family noncanonical pyrimidine nucleotidase [Flavobacteriales bacterium]
MKQYEHLFFDLDGTLWDLWENSRAALTTMFTAYPALTDRTDQFENFFSHYHRHNHHLWMLLRQNKVKKDELRVRRFRLAFADTHIDCEPWVEKFADDFMQLCPRQGKLVPGAKALLEQLNGKYPMHIVSNGFPEVQSIKMETSGIAQYFSEVILSEHIGVSKPHPDIFQYALDAARTQRNTSLMIGDDWEADIVGAREAGMDQAFLTLTETRMNPDFDRHITSPPTYLLHRIKDLLEHVS